MFKRLFNCMSRAAAYLTAAIASLFGVAHAGMGADAATEVGKAATEANLVYVAVIAAIAAFFVVKLIRKAL